MNFFDLVCAQPRFCPLSREINCPVIDLLFIKNGVADLRREDGRGIKGNKFFKKFTRPKVKLGRVVV